MQGGAAALRNCGPHPCPSACCCPCRYLPDDLADTSDSITAPRSWHFSTRSHQLDEERQQELAGKCPVAK